MSFLGGETQIKSQDTVLFQLQIYLGENLVSVKSHEEETLARAIGSIHQRTMAVWGGGVVEGQLSDLDSSELWGRLEGTR